MTKIQQLREKLETTRRLTRFVMEKEACNAGLNLCDALEKVLDEYESMVDSEFGGTKFEEPIKTQIKELIEKELNKERGVF